MTGSVFVVAAANVADVYSRATLYIFKLIVILQIQSHTKREKKKKLIRIPLNVYFSDNNY